FFLYPTFDHQRSDLVRESHQPELRRALEEGVWADGEPPLNGLGYDACIEQPDRVRIRAWAEVAGHWTIDDPRCVDALSPYYVWTTDYAEKRLAWRRRAGAGPRQRRRRRRGRRAGDRRPGRAAGHAGRPRRADLGAAAGRPGSRTADARRGERGRRAAQCRRRAGRAGHDGPRRLS